MSAAADHIVVLGGGVSGLTAACELRRLGYDVTIYEKNSALGGRAAEFKADGFTWDLGPSWYWMPELYDMIFQRFGVEKAPYNLTRLDPAYRVIKENQVIDVPGTTEKFISWSNESKIQGYFDKSTEMYKAMVHDWLWRPMGSPLLMLDPFLALNALRFDFLRSLKSTIESYVSSESVRELLGWPVVFVGLSPETARTFWAFLSFCSTNTFYPDGGLSAPVKALAEIAIQQGVKVELESEITELQLWGNRVRGVCVGSDCFNVSGVVAAADYHHVEQSLLPANLRHYDPPFWKKQLLSPSCLLYYLGFNRQLPQLLHHTFYFGADLYKDLEEQLHTMPAQPKNFYVSATSKTDPSVTQEGGETVFVLVPFSDQFGPDLDTPELRKSVLEHILNRMFQTTTPEGLVSTHDYGPKDFLKNHNAYRGNAFGHANTVLQTLIFKPTMQSKVENLLFAGHLTHPGPGMPPAMVSGIVAAGKLDKQLRFSPPLWSVVFLACCLIFCLLKFFSIRFRSYLRCCWYFYTGGRTYFAAATLMNPSRFFDTAAMYALFRAADDCVDTHDDAEEVKREKLAVFEKNFWQCLREGVGKYDLHPIFPAVIETSLRRGYADRLFEDFFRSMRMDEGKNVCETEADTFYYMEGSAAVIGEFMLPILQPDESYHKELLPHARDLGRAFQMTNFIRDISEDLDLGRQYIPEEACKRHNVRLKDKDASISGFTTMMEEMFAYTDKFYTSADVGIAMLAPDVCHVIRVARKMYHEIHNKIRDANYDVFSGKLKVPFSKKIMIAANEIPIVQYLRIVAIECITLIVWNAPWIFVLAWACFTTSFHMEAPTYFQFHCIFTIPVFLWTFPPREVMREVLILTTIACIVTTPWDNYMVANGGWSYYPERYWKDQMVYGWVPIEEYMFFVLETFIVCGTFMHMAGGAKFKPIPKTWPRWPIYLLGVVSGLGGWYLCRYYFYLGSIVVLTVPPIVVQFWYRVEVIWPHMWTIGKCVTVLSVYLGIIDQWAIARGAWLIDDTHFDAVPGLPVEELLFFVATTYMCCQGFVLIKSVLPEVDDWFARRKKKSE